MKNITTLTQTNSIFPNLLDISQPFNGILLDAYGIFWGGNSYGLFPGSKERMEELVTANKIVGILSNSTQLASKEIDKWQKHGLIQGKHFHFLITSGEIARRAFINQQLPFETLKSQFWLFAGVHPTYASPLTLFEESSYTETNHISDADFIYISVPHIDGEDQVDPLVFLEEVKNVKQTNLPMVCANPDRYAHEGNPPRSVVRQGSIAKLYEEMGGSVFYFGKPYSIAYEAALEAFQAHKILEPEAILMVGDTPETDIRGANQAGMSSALTLKTGMMAERLQNNDFDLVLSQLPAGDYPDYLIERL